MTISRTISRNVAHLNCTLKPKHDNLELTSDTPWCVLNKSNVTVFIRTSLYTSISVWAKDKGEWDYSALTCLCREPTSPQGHQRSAYTPSWPQTVKEAKSQQVSSVTKHRREEGRHSEKSEKVEKQDEKDVSAWGWKRVCAANSHASKASLVSADKNRPHDSKEARLPFRHAVEIFLQKPCFKKDGLVIMKICDSGKLPINIQYMSYLPSLRHHPQTHQWCKNIFCFNISYYQRPPM